MSATELEQEAATIADELGMAPVEVLAILRTLVRPA